MKTNHRKLSYVPGIGVLLLMLMLTTASAQICSVNAGLDKIICITQQPLLLNGTVGSTQASVPPEYQWTKLTGPSGIITSPNTLNTTVTGLTPGNYVFQLSNKCIDGFLAKDIVSITVLPEPQTAVAGPDMFFCYNSAVQLSGNIIASPCVGTWTVMPEGGTFTPNQNDPHAIYNSLPLAGVRKIIWTISNGACQNADTLRVVFSEAVTPVSAGYDTTLSCKGKCWVLKASYPGYAPQHGLWTLVSGPNTPTFSDPSSANSKVCNLLPGIYRFRWTVSGPCINDSDDVTITLANIKEPPVSFGDMNYNDFCESPSVTSQVLTGAPPIMGDVVSWVQTGGGSTATFNPDNHQASVMVDNLTGTFPYTFEFTQTNLAGCTFVTKHTVYRSQFITGLTDPADQQLSCDVTGTTFNISFDKISTVSSSITRKATFISGPIDTGKIQFTGSAVTGLTITDTWTLNNLTAPGTYIYRVEYSTACGSTTQDISITVSRTPGSVNAGSDIVLPCQSLSVGPVGSVNIPGSYTWTQVTGPSNAEITDPATLSPSLSGLVQGIYTIQLSSWGGNACPLKTDNMNITVTQLPPAIAIIHADTAICAGSYQLGANVPLSTETGSWTVTPSAGVSFYPDSTKPNAIVTGLEPETVYTFTWTINNVCGSVSASQVVTTGAFFSPPVPNAGDDLCEEYGTHTITLFGSDPGTSGITWTALSPGSSIVSTNTQATQAIFDGGSGSYLFEYAFSSPGCAAKKDLVMITIKSNIIINAGADINICAASLPASANLHATVIHPLPLFTATWSQLSGPSIALIASPTNRNSTITNLVPGIYQFEYSQLQGNGCEQNADTILVVVSASPSDADAGPDQSICNVMPGTIVTHAAVSPNVGEGYWEVISAPPGSSTALFSNQHLATSTISNLTQGIYHLRWTVTNGAGCQDKTDDMDILVNAAANAGIDISGCNAANIQLTGSPNTNGTWSIVSGPPGASIMTNSGNTAIVSGLITATVPTVYVFKYSLPDLDACGSTIDNMVFTNYPPPSQANGGPDKILCFDDITVRITGNNPSSGKGSWMWQSGPNIPSPGLSNTSSIDTSLNNLIPGIYVYQYRVNTNGACTASVDNVQIVKLTKANAGTDSRTCNVSTIYLNANVPLLGQGTWSYISGPLAPGTILFSNIHDPSSSATGLIAGTYIFRWNLSATGTCIANFDDVQVIIDPAVPFVDAGASQAFCQGTAIPFTIGSNAIPGITYSWSPVALLSNPNIAQPIFSGINNTGNFIYTLKASIGSCESYSTINIHVNPAPFANIEITEGGCAANFIASSPGAGVNDPVYNWNFGNNVNPGTASGPGPHHVVFSNSGTRNIMLDIISADGCSNSTSVNYYPLCVLPVKLLSFDAVWKKNYADISWLLENAINFSHFELERSYDGTSFSSLQEINYYSNQKNYNYPDRTVNNLTNTEVFYRLKLLDNNNEFSYSPVRSIKFRQDENISIWPNPFNDRISIKFKSPGTGSNVLIKIYNATGAMIMNKKMNLAQNNNFIEINNLTRLATGFYTLQIITEGNKISNYKIIKHSL
ncbi:MAG: T9SS type A sorting domain-containing protein [Ferruginibacter sp.]